MAATAPVVTEHRPWCVRDHERGACSTKRGKWDRSSNTWIPEMTNQDRNVIAEALTHWQAGEWTLAEAAAYVRAEGDTLHKVDDAALYTWNMTQKRMARMGRSWPVS